MQNIVMKTKDNTSDIFRRAVQHDADIQPDRALESRLMNYYQLRRPRRRVYSNSFTGFFAWMFSSRLLGLKAGIISLGLFYMLFIGNINSHNQAGLLDSCLRSPMVADTSFVAKDTCK